MTRPSPTAFLVVGMLIAGGALTAWRLLEPPGAGNGMTIPQLSPLAAAGQVAFEANCASCHGKNAAGSDRGPPFIHPIYNPGHHSDQAFYLAVRRGVLAHHWPFGDMPPQPQASEAELRAIVQYVRELQRANGIVYEPHRM